MKNNTNNTNNTTTNSTKADTRNAKLEDFNDQLGENASEEFKSEKYANAFKNDTRNQGMK